MSERPQPAATLRVVDPGPRVGGLRWPERALRMLAREGVTEVSVVGDAPLDVPEGLTLSPADGTEAGVIWHDGVVVDRARLQAALATPGPVHLRADPEADAEADLDLEADLDPDQEVDPDPLPGWALHVREPARVTRRLFEDCRKSVDGLVARHFNRYVSLAISRRLVHAPITPNQVSYLTFLVGVAAALVTALGTYGAMLGGALLFQLNSVLDGVDGELARVRMQSSKLGEWIDTVSDDLCNVMFYAAVAYASAGLAAEGSLPAWLAPMGYAACGFAAGTMFFYYRELIALGRGDYYALDWGTDADEGPPSLGQRVVAVFVLLLKKDALILGFVAAAAAGVLPYSLPVVLGGTVITFVAGLVRTLRRPATRP